MDNTSTKSELTDAMRWRYATKKMNGAIVPDDKLQRILESIRLSASSMGLQPYRVMVISDMELRKKLQPAAYGQQQIVGCSHLLVFAVQHPLGFAEVNRIVELTAHERQVGIDSLSGYKAMLEQAVLNKSPEGLFHWATKQAYISLGSGLVAAAMEKVDATPMEGFNPESFDEILGLQAMGLKSVALLALGYRDGANDPNASKKKVRIPAEEFFIWQ
ncbi:MAG: NAD(P)H-dependent oxidoreductase [Bacteroidota bacterium]